MASTRQKATRHESGPVNKGSPRLPRSSDLDNTGVAPSISPSTPTGHQLHAIRLELRLHSLSSKRTALSHVLPSRKTSQIAKRRRGGSVLVELHQPIGFVCCHCRYRSSGSYCSNPDYAECPHKTLPRCSNCPIIFTTPRMRYGTCEGG